MLGDHRAGAEVGVLVGMRLDRQAVGLRLGEQPAHLLVVEADLVAEAVDLIDEVLLHRLGQHLVAHEVDIVVAPSGIFRCQTVRAEERRDRRDRQVASQRARDPHQPQLGLLVEAGARLALDRRDAIGDQPAHARAARVVERLLRQRPRALHHAADTAAARLEVPALAALRQHLEVDQPLLAVDDVGVRIDQARASRPCRRDPRPCPRRPPARRRRGRSRRPCRPVMPIAPVAHQAEGRVVVHGGDAAVGQQQVEHGQPTGMVSASGGSFTTLAYQAVELGMARPPRLVGVAEVEIAQRAADGDLADRVSLPSESACFSNTASGARHLALLQRDVALAALVLRQRDLAAARLGGIENAVAQRLLRQRLPARRAGRRETAWAPCRCCRDIRRSPGCRRSQRRRR